MRRFVSIFSSLFVIVLVAGLLLAPARRLRNIHILPGNGWTHVRTPLSWTNNGTHGPGHYWNRTEYGLRAAWLVHDQAVRGTRSCTRADPFYLSLYLMLAIASGILTYASLYCVLRDRTTVL